eukprot:3886127-Amphidinium_carterae.1
MCSMTQNHYYTFPDQALAGGLFECFRGTYSLSKEAPCHLLQVTTGNESVQSVTQRNVTSVAPNQIYDISQ